MLSVGAVDLKERGLVKLGSRHLDAFPETKKGGHRLLCFKHTLVTSVERCAGQGVANWISPSMIKQRMHLHPLVQLG
jgi:hypothetical protein